MKISIVVLTYNRIECLKRQIRSLAKISYKDIEIIVVDNGSKYPIDEIVKTDSRLFIINNNENLGAVGRNKGIERASGDIIITVDDDVFGINDDHINIIINQFDESDISAVNFKVKEEGTGNVVNWCHPYDFVTHSECVFETDGISEGAVAFRRRALDLVGLYPEYFFISHEGPDLAYRLINAGWRIIYNPEITVVHAYEQCGRVSWRRYYFDTRNQLWFVLRNLSFAYGVKRLIIGWGSMFVYSVRDGFLLFWFKGIWDSLLGVPRAWRDRVPPTQRSREKWQLFERYRPNFWVMLRRRLFSKGVRI